MKGKRDMKGKGSVDQRKIMCVPRITEKKITYPTQLSPRDQEIEEKTVTAVNLKENPP